jgi:class 3 adenylate cyclase/tetratricopeptide (TPR) repeat protein
MSDHNELARSGALPGRNDRDLRELRPVSILCCDIVDSTGLSRRLHPEDFQDLLVRFRETCVRLTEQASGQVVQSVGDAVLVCFGYSAAHEEDSRRALRTALNMVRDFKNAKFKDVSLAVRVAVASGTVPTGHPDVPIDSAITNLVARLTKIAEPDSVVTDARTYELTQPVFECTDLGNQTLKGFAEPIRLWRVDRAREIAVRFDAKARYGLTPFVDREAEMATLLGRWGEAQKGRGQVVLLGGEPGIGKSRLTQVFQERIRISDPQLLRLQCFPDQRNTALQPLIDQFRRALELSPEAPIDAQLNKIERFIAGWSNDVRRLAPIYAELLSVASNRYGQVERNPEKLRLQTEEALLEYLTVLAHRAPCLIVVEDINWADPTTRAVLGVIISKASNLPLLLLATFRQWEFDIPWLEMDHVTLLKLEQLDDLYRHQLVQNLVASRLLSSQQQHHIVSRGGGVPLFLEELTKNALETGHTETMPGQLETLLHARLDHVGKTRLSGPETARSVKDVAQVAAVIGWEFSLELLNEVLAPDNDGGSNSELAGAIEVAIDRLVESELIRRHGNTCRFSHVLIREEAYRSLLQRRRDQLHARIARVLKERADHFGASPELVARHCEAAGFADDAIQFWQLAGRREARRSSNQEAEHHFCRAIEAANARPDTLGNLIRRLELHNDLGPVMMASYGFASPAVEQVYERAVHLGARTGRPLEIYFPAVAGLQLVRIVQGRHREAFQLADELLTIAKEADDPGYLIEAYRHRGAVLFWMGEVARSRADLEQVLALYKPEHQELKYVFGTDPKVSTLVFLSMAASLVGRFGEAATRGREALELARSTAHHHTQGYANLAVALSADLRREPQEASEKASAAVQLGSEIPFWAAWAKVIYGRTLLRDPASLQTALSQIAVGMEEYRKTGAGLAETYFKLVSAEAQAANANLPAALQSLEDGLILTERGGEHFCEPELLRTKGEMLLRIGAIDTDVERCFQAALDMAKRRGLRLYELRAAVSLSRLWRGRRRQDKAKERIAAILSVIEAPPEASDYIDARRALES